MSTNYKSECPFCGSTLKGTSIDGLSKDVLHHYESTHKDASDAMKTRYLLSCAVESIQIDLG